jgi:hypothetical protein
MKTGIAQRMFTDATLRMSRLCLPRIRKYTGYDPRFAGKWVCIPNYYAVRRTGCVGHGWIGDSPRDAYAQASLAYAPAIPCPL